MTSYYQRFLLVLGTFGLAGLVALAFLFSLAKKDSENATLPLGLTLVQHQGQLVVADAMQVAKDYGLQSGDVITCVDHFVVSTEARFREAIADKQTGDLISIGIQRGGDTITLNERYHGAIEVPAQQAAEALANTPLKRRSSEAKTPFQEAVAESALASPRLDYVHVTMFGLQVLDQGEKMTVTRVEPGSAGEAFGVQVDDVLFQIDRTTINSLNDLHEAAAGQTVGGTANLMLIRGDAIVLLPEIVLGGAGQDVVAPEDYTPVVMAFSSFTEESLAELLEDPFKQFFSPVPKAPSITHMPSISATPAPNAVVANESLDGLSVEEINIPDAPVTDSPEVASPDASLTAPPIVDLLVEDDPRPLDSDIRVKRFAEIEMEATGDTELASDVPEVIAEPKTVPRFHKYSTFRLPDLPSMDREAKDWATIETSTLEGTGITSRYDSDQAETESDATDANNTASVGQPEDASWQSADLPAELHQLADANADADAESSLSQPSDVVQTQPYGTREVARRRRNPPEVSNNIAGGAPMPPPDSSRRDTSTSIQSLADGPVKTNETHSPQVGTATQERSPAHPSYSLCAECGAHDCTDCDSPGGESGLTRLLHGRSPSGITFGGWLAAGYHSESNDLFNDRPDKLALHQGWLYVEREASCDQPFGFRADIMYGIDGREAQAFGNDIGTWDFENGFDFGAYSWAIPQLYAEVVLGDWNILAGHFFTKVGYETVTAPDNFFYSHAITMYNSEPFTHTGILAERSIGEKAAIFAGWTLGWDTGFDQFNGGSSWLGGFGYELSENIKSTFMSTAGNFGARGDDAYSHSIVLEMGITDRWLWVVQSDYLSVDSTGEDNIGLNQYLLYTVNEKLDIGARLEWWKGDVLTGYAPHGGVLPAFGSLSYYETTVGVNYRPHERIRLRPEARIDWSPAANYDATYFGIDAILTF